MTRGWGLLLALFFVAGASAQGTLVLKVSGTEGRPAYTRDLLDQAFRESGQPVRWISMGDVPVGRREAMLADGRLTVAIMGSTVDRDNGFIPIRVGMTDGLESKRVLLIPRGTQHEFDGVKTLEDFRRLGKVAGVGSLWAEAPIWAANQLPFQAVGGDWRSLFSMVALGHRGVDYLPRGLNEVTSDLARHPNLDLERHLVLVYPGDHILYLSPRNPELKAPLEAILDRARDSGLIRRFAARWYPDATGPAVGLDRRTILDLRLPGPGF